MTKPPSKTTVLKCVSAEVGRKLPTDPDELRQVLRDAVDVCTLQEPTPTKEEFYRREYWYDPRRGRHPASGSGRLPSKESAQIEIREVGGEQAIRIYNPWTKEEIYYYDLNQMDEAKERFKNLYAETFGTEAEPTYRLRQPPTGSGLQMQVSLEGGGGQTYFAGSSPQRQGKPAATRTPRKREKKGSGSLAMFGVMPEGQTTLVEAPTPTDGMTLRQFVRDYYDKEPSSKRIIYDGKDHTEKSAKILCNKSGQGCTVAPSPYTKGRYVVYEVHTKEPFEVYYQKYKDELNIIYRQKYM